MSVKKIQLVGADRYTDVRSKIRFLSGKIYTVKDQVAVRLLKEADKQTGAPYFEEVTQESQASKLAAMRDAAAARARKKAEQDFYGTRGEMVDLSGLDGELDSKENPVDLNKVEEDDALVGVEDESVPAEDDEDGDVVVVD